ncbi:MAG: hypothetical protein ACR2JC_09925 [Chloroflexota bacterium]|nr:MAG: hypothetical protein DLM70_12575 [Chloroflexota bacterium]
MLLECYGLPLEKVRARLVHGCLYLRPIGVGQGDKVRPVPPVAIMKILARVHPELRRRNRAADRAWPSRLWRTEVDSWFDHEREKVIALNLGFQSVHVIGLDDRSLAVHIAELLSHFAFQARKTLEHHGGDMIPVGDYLAHSALWGIASRFGRAAAWKLARYHGNLAGSRTRCASDRALRPPSNFAAIGTRPRGRSQEQR